MTDHASSHVINTVTSRARLSRIAALLPCALLAGCAVGEPGVVFGTYEANLVAQLEASSDALAARGVPLQLVGYTAAAPLDSNDAVLTTKTQILDAGALVPQFNGLDPTSLTLSSIGERTLAYRAGTNDQDVVTNIETMAFPSIRSGQRTLDVTWASQGREFQTKLVYDDSGIVYDNMLSNIAFLEPDELSAGSPPPVPTTTPRLDGYTAFANQIFTRRFVNFNILWVWGGVRGQVQLDHYVISCDGWVSFCDDGGSANAWMSLGSAEGRTRRHALIKPRISKLAWAYGWATPTASVNITWNSSTLTFSASISGIGSAGKGSGIDPIF